MNSTGALTYERLAKALFENYESIYDIDLTTNEYKVYHESKEYESLNLEREGTDFFKALSVNIPNIIFKEDQAFVLKKLSKGVMKDALRQQKYYSFIYRIAGRQNQYHQIRATSLVVESHEHVLMGIKNINDLIMKEKAQLQLQQELKMCKARIFSSQMQPHFLYNALASIQEVILEDPEYAAELLGDFSIHLRGCIRAMDSDDCVPFKEELRNIRAYVNIEKMRLGQRLSIHYDIDVDDFPILPLSIQPLVENAIRHGIFPNNKRPGTVSLKTSNAKYAWIIQVHDDGVGFDADAFLKNPNKEESAGLKNLIFRLEKVQQAIIDIDSVPGEGTTVTVVIPKERKHESDYSR